MGLSKRVFKDCSYRCRSGTCFYNREYEVGVLSDYVERSSYLIVWGPRNIGKSELLRYFTWRVSREGYHVIYIDCRETLSRETIKLMGPRDPRSLFREVVEALGLGYIVKAYELLSEVIGRVESNGVIWVFDEAHKLDHYDRVLEALIKKTIYEYHDKVFITIISSSEGWFLRGSLVKNLREYGARDLLVKPLDKKVFIEYGNELQKLYNVELEASLEELYSEYIGGNPGYLLEIISFNSLDEWVKHVKKWFIEVVNEVIIETGVKPEEISAILIETPTRKDPAEIRSFKKLLDKLMEKNIIYYNLEDNEYFIDVQLPIYRKLASTIH